MLGWIFKKKPETTPRADASPRAASNAASSAAPPSKAQASGKAPRKVPADETNWRERLQAAQGNDSALLDVARQASPIDVKCAAIEALVDEASLKQAEREFRSHDRRVHRLAKQRFEAAVAQRQARARADELIASASALLDEPTIPTNRLVELDRAWQALDAARLGDAQKNRFAEVSSRLTELTRERGEREQQARRWTSEADVALKALHAAVGELAAGHDATGGMTQAAATAAALASNVPEGPAAAALGQSLQGAVHLASQVGFRVAFLEALSGAPADSHPPASQWQALPPIADPRLARMLDQRFADWQAAREAPRAEAPQPEKPRAPTTRTPAPPVRTEAIAPRLQQAEEALESGNLAQAQASLSAIDATVGAGEVPKALQARLHAVQAEVARLKGWQHWGGGRARDDLVQEAQTLAAATAAALADPQQAAKLPVKQLADAIDDLRKRWKDLDRLGGATNQTLWQTFDAACKSAYEPVAAHLDQLKARRQQNLEVRLALLDALDAVATPQDTAATAEDNGNPAAPAHSPDVEAEALVDDDREGADAASTQGTRPAGESGEDPAPVQHADAAPAQRADTAPPAQRADRVSAQRDSPFAAQPADWKEMARALDHFHVEWRKLGPVEHTVPRKAVDKLTARLQASVSRVEAPLKAARQAAQSEREQMVASARSLAAQAASDPQSRELIPRVRELQERWQHHARALPLVRPVEKALWAEFKTATDAVFAQRDAAHDARDAEMAAHLAARETLVSQLEALGEQTPEADIKRTLAEVDAAWRRAGEAPRNHAARLEARLQAAHQAALQILSGSAQRAWQAGCDALAARLALCEEIEDGAPAGAADGWLVGIDARWSALGAPPAAWQRALDARWKRGRVAVASAPGSAAPEGPPASASPEARTSLTEPAESTRPATAPPASPSALPPAATVSTGDVALDTLLLQLEVALEVPSPAEHQAARRDIKLQAMKAALEGRVAANTAPADADGLWTHILAQARPAPRQRERIAALLSALRNKGVMPSARRA